MSAYSTSHLEHLHLARSAICGSLGNLTVNLRPIIGLFGVLVSEAMALFAVLRPKRFQVWLLARARRSFVLGEVLGYEKLLSHKAAPLLLRVLGLVALLLPLYVLMASGALLHGLHWLFGVP